ncbi:sigma-70 family RNA polymerase sigma factor [Paenibacillus filicis]|uniref:Sigma-70 family RNA polymerase sigma factor n=1 Tax=Paenibacillus filicis TaxID=669464 RepID=A0ABU9DPP2_9BACL
MEINALIQQVRQGDVDCFEPIIRKYEQQIYRFCLFLLGDRQEAEDAAQDIFFKSYQYLHRFDPAQSFSAWLHKIAENHCRNLLKRRRRWYHLLPLFRPTGQARSAEQVYAENMGTELGYWFHGLSVPEKKLLFLRVVEDYSFEEIAQMMEESASTVRKRFERLRVKLRGKKPQREEVTGHEQRLELR